MNLMERNNYVFSWMLNIVCCRVVGLWLGLVLDLVSRGWLVVMQTHSYYFLLSLSPSLHSVSRAIRTATVERDKRTDGKQSCSVVIDPSIPFFLLALTANPVPCGHRGVDGAQCMSRCVCPRYDMLVFGTRLSFVIRACHCRISQRER